MFKLKGFEKVLYTLVFIMVLLGVALSHIDIKFYEGFYAREDGLVEWLTVLALALGSFVCFYRIYILYPFKQGLFLASLVMFGLLFIFGLGEEISWGQRLLGFKSPTFFINHNSQMETNFHNLQFNGFKINKIIFGTFLGICVGFYFLILPFLYQKFDKVKRLVNTIALPLPRYFHILSYILLAILCEFIAGGKKGEILEFGGCWIFTLMVFEPYNREIFSRTTFEGEFSKS